MGSLELMPCSDCPRHVVDLDEAPELRWAKVVAAHVHQLPAVLKLLEATLGGGFVKEVASLAYAALAMSGKINLGHELEGIAKASGIPVGTVAVLQLAYEVFAACTSIVVEVKGRELGLDGDDAENELIPFHIRTVDGPLEKLSNMTCEVDFVRQGHVVFSATTWPGYVGVLTGVRPGAFSVSVNRRYMDGSSIRGTERELILNMFKCMSEACPVSFLVRDVLERASTYFEAITSLQVANLSTPAYITVAGAVAGEGTVITRARTLTLAEGPPVQRNNSFGTASASGCSRRSSAGMESSAGALPGWHLAIHGPIVQANHDWFAAATAGAMDCCGDSSPDSKASSDGVYFGLGSPRNVVGDSVERSTFGHAAIAALNGAVTPKDLWLLMSTAPCRAPDTVYTSAMCARTGQLLTRAKSTRRHERLGERKWGRLAQRAFDGEFNEAAAPLTMLLATVGGPTAAALSESIVGTASELRQVLGSNSDLNSDLCRMNTF